MPARIEPRKIPTQERARETVDSLMEAAARILVREGFEKASTNRIAREAGVSIGSLYQYFPSKEALIAALARRHSEEVVAELAKRLEELSDDPLPRLVQEAIRLLVEAHERDSGLHRVLFERAHVTGAIEAERMAIEVLRKLLESRSSEIGSIDPAVAAPLLFHGVEAVIHRTPRYLGERARAERLERELIRLVLGYLTPLSSMEVKGGHRRQRSRANLK